MSQHTVYRCDGCGFEDLDPSFLFCMSDDGERDWCADCEADATADAPATDNVFA